MGARRALGEPAIAVGAAAAAALLGLGIAVAADETLLPPAAASIVLLVAVCATVATASARGCLRAARGEVPWTHVGSLFLSLGSVIGFVIPAVQLLGGDRESRIAQQGFVVIDSATKVSEACLLVSLALVVFFCGELIAAAQLGRRRPRSWRPLLRWNDRTTWIVLVVISALPVILLAIDTRSPQAIFSARGTAEGRGFQAVLGWAPAVAVSLATLRRHFGSRSALAVSAALVTFLIVLAGNRSPLLLILVALAVRYLPALRSSRRALRTALVAVLAIYLGAAMLVSISEWRGQTIRGEQASLSRSTTKALADPIGRLSGAGLDSLDGLVLSTSLNRREVGADWSDLTKVVTGFVPHQLWPAKPNWLTVTVAQTYLRFRASGMFLSGVGYGWLVGGGILGVVAIFLLLGWGSSLALGRVGGPFGIGTALIVYFLIRFMFAGDAFDGFHALGLAGLTAFAAAIARVGDALRP